MKESLKANEKKDELKFWKLSYQELLAHFNTSERGYDKEVYQKLKSKYKPNELEEEEKESILDKILEQFEDILVRILLIAAIISFILALTGDHNEGIAAYIEPFVILLILVANAAIGVIQEINADKAIDSLKKLQSSHCHVKRGNQVERIDSIDLIPGDIVILNEGEKAPADIRILEIDTSNFEVNEAFFTGEPSTYKISDSINNDKKPETVELKNTIFSSSGIIVGSGYGIVIATGMDTYIGSMLESIRDSENKKEKTPLKKKLEEFGENLTYIIGAICIIVWVINYRHFFDEVHGTFINGMIYYFKISVALAVAAIPEGLPAVITTCLALGSRRLSAANAIVRKLDSIETLGCTSVICSDKTGTLTTNNMSTTRFMVIEDDNVTNTVVKDVQGISFKPEGKINEFDSNYYENSTNIKLLAIASSICNKSEIKFEKESNAYSIIGTPTEGAIKVFVEKLRDYDREFKSTDSSNPMAYNQFITANYKLLYVLEFDRIRKSMSALALNTKTNKPVLFVKGAAEILINQSVNYYTRSGAVANLTDQSKTKLLNQINENFTSKSLRSLAVCIKEDLPLLKGVDVNNKESLKLLFKEKSKVNEIEQGLTLLGVVGMLDPPRPEVKNSIQTCGQAGIRVIMITGDNKATAEAIGKEIGLISTEGGRHVSSFNTRDFVEMPAEEKKKVLARNDNLIFSRSEPEHKRQLVKDLKALGHIVAMTGDGVNDAPALAEANIGIAMGITGTDVAKEASHIILADDNFASIVKAVEEGRSIYMNMKAFIRYLISSNIGEVVSIFLTSLFGIPEAFTSIQLLWVNYLF